MGFDTINDLRTDALWLAGEPTAASVSDYYTRALAYLDAVQDAVITGGSLRNVVDLPLEDWRWARPQPRRSIDLVKPYTLSTVTCTLTPLLDTGTFSGAVAGPFVGWRIKIPDEDDVPQITINPGPNYTAFTLDHVWKGAAVATTDWELFKVEYQLPADHVRLVSGMILPGYGEFNVVDRRTLEDNFPFYLITEGNPQMAALVSERWLRFSHYPASPGASLEYDSIVRPSRLETDATPAVTEPTVPKPFRRILSTGAAMLILIDKNDQKHKEVFEQFQSIWLAMKKANSRPQHRAARGYGYIKPRLEQLETRIRTTTGGLPVLW